MTQFRIAASLALLAHSLVGAQPNIPINGATYPGVVELRVDATDLDHRVLRVQQSLPVRGGQALVLHFPRWIPGTHSPTGDVSALAGLKITARDQPVAWTRDPLDTHTFRLNVPAGAQTLALNFEFLSAVTPSSGRVVMTPEMLNLQWNNLVLYPAGFEARNIRVKASVRLPSGFGYGTALRAERDDTADIEFKTVSLETLVDSPVFAGRHLKRYALDPAGAARPVTMTIVADRPEQLKASEAQIEAHRELVRQADQVFASRHFAKYDFLLALSSQLGGIGLEHHESSENGVKPKYFEDWDKAVGARDLLPHEYVHSWNGKFRRPADLNAANFNVATQNSLLWLYEGQTQFWGWVLAARSGLVSAAQARDVLAQDAANFEYRVGRNWRNLQDTTYDAIMTGRRGNKDWRSWQRGSGDYYGESLLIWLDVDSLIREKSGSSKSIDDFARVFFAMRDGELGPLTYTFDDIVQTLNGVLPFDWAKFLRQRLDSTMPAAPLDGLARGGWKLNFSDTPSDEYKADEAEYKNANFTYSLGLMVGEGDKLDAVQWNGPAFQAGLAPGAILLAVNQRAYKAESLKTAISNNKDGSAPIELLVRDGEVFRTVRIDYRDGLRYPKLERLPDVEDRLASLLQRR
jgi:predicted metalloprotease with PDZ domain